MKAQAGRRTLHDKQSKRQSNPVPDSLGIGTIGGRFFFLLITEPVERVGGGQEVEELSCNQRGRGGQHFYAPNLARAKAFH